MVMRVAISAFVALVVAMGIGRFAFTPQVPLMIEQHQLTLTSAAVVAALNYLGYLCGCWNAMRASRWVEVRLKLGVWGAVLLTLLSAIADNPLMHSFIRFAIGWVSGWVMVLVAAWSNEQLLKANRQGLSAAVFAGPGFGIVISGLLAVLLHHLQLNAGWAWCVYGIVALLMVISISHNLPGRGALHRPDCAPAPLKLTPALKKLVWSYSLAGFGYILPATFLSQMALSRFPHSLFAQFVWPVFGGAAVIGILLGIFTRHLLSTHRRLALVLWGQALGVFCPEIMPGMGGLVIGAVLVGGGFLCVVQLSLQVGRELAPLHTRYMAGLLITGYAVGQLTGPLMSAMSTLVTHRLEPALYVAGVTLVIAGFLVWPERRDSK